MRKFLIGQIIISAFALASCGGGRTSDSKAESVIQLLSPEEPIVLGGQVGQSTWADSSGDGKPRGNVECLKNEDYHKHFLVRVFSSGRPLALPAGIGLIGCAYELHTHDRSGIVHIETAHEKFFTLVDFFNVWGQQLSSNNVAGISGIARVFVLPEHGTAVTEITNELAIYEIKNHDTLIVLINTPTLQLRVPLWPQNL